MEKRLERRFGAFMCIRTSMRIDSDAPEYKRKFGGSLGFGM